MSTLTKRDLVMQISKDTDLHPDLRAGWNCTSLSYSPSNGPR